MSSIASFVAPASRHDQQEEFEENEENLESDCSLSHAPLSYCCYGYQAIHSRVENLPLKIHSSVLNSGSQK